MDIWTNGIGGGRGPGRWWALAAIVVSGLVIGLDTTILVTALPTLAQKLGASTSELQWISTAYTLALGGLLLPAGVLGDRLGRKRLLLLGLLLFGAGSVAASQMTTASGLIAMRAVMGAGAAIIVPLSLSILPTLFSERERPRAVALATVGAFLGLPLGPLVAGWLLTHYDWGSVFLINAPVIALALAGVGFLVPESRDTEARSLDWIGAILAVAGVTGLVYGVIEEPDYGWTDARVVAALAGSVLVLAAFVGWALRSRSPFVDLRLFLRPRFTWATAAFTGVGFGMIGVMFVLTPYLQVVQGNDAQGTGIRLLPLIAGVVVGAGGGDRLTARLGAKIMVAGGLLVTGAGLLLLSRAGVDTGYGLVAAALAVVGLGMGLAMPTAMDAVLGALPEGQTGVGMGLTRTLQQVAASLGVAILGSILNSAYQGGLHGHLAGLPAPARDAMLSSVAGAAVVARHVPGPLGRPLLHTAFGAYVDGMAEVMIVSAVMMGVVAVLVVLFLPARAAAAGAEPARPEAAVRSRELQA
jgi:EmrB/QacA subfamily drug resistance transporter